MSAGTDDVGALPVPDDRDARARLAAGVGFIGDAVLMMRLGHLVARSGWNGKGMYLYLALTGTAVPGRYSHHDLTPFVAMRAADGTHVPWLASQTDLLAQDWTEVVL